MILTTINFSSLNEWSIVGTALSICRSGDITKAMDFLDSYAESLLTYNDGILDIDESYEAAKKNLGYLAISCNVSEKEYRMLEEVMGVYHPFFADPFKVTSEEAIKRGYEDASEFKRGIIKRT